MLTPIQTEIAQLRAENEALKEQLGTVQSSENEAP